MIKSEPTLEIYIEVLDRILEREGLSTIERDEIFKDPSNLTLISDSFKKRIHPKIVLQSLNKESVRRMYADSEYSVVESLQDFITEDEQTTNFTPGQQYAVKFLKTLELELISNTLQLKRGNLIFKDSVNTKLEWMISNTGYIRKKEEGIGDVINKAFGNIRGHQWQVLARLRAPQYEEKGKISDDEYMEAAHILSEKVRRSRKPKNDFRQSYVNKAYKLLSDTIDDLLTSHYRLDATTKPEIIEAIKKLYNKYLKE